MEAVGYLARSRSAMEFRLAPNHKGQLWPEGPIVAQDDGSVKPTAQPEPLVLQQKI
jgi:hypothetical protein